MNGGQGFSRRRDLGQLRNLERQLEDVIKDMANPSLGILSGFARGPKWMV